MTDVDPIIRQLREAISDNDRKLIETLNKRLELVARLKRYKESRGIGFVDPEREEWILNYLQRANRGSAKFRKHEVLRTSCLEDLACALRARAIERLSKGKRFDPGLRRHSQAAPRTNG